MFKSLFRARSANRDAESDDQRTQRILDILSTVEHEIRAEIAGLQRRSNEARAKASSRLLALEGDSVSQTNDRHLREFEIALTYAEQRLERLDTQLQRLFELQGGASGIN